VFISNTLFQVSTEEDRPTFLATNSFLANLTAFVAPMIGTLLADLLGIRIALVIGSLVRAAGSLVFWKLRVGHEERAQESAP
jgi:dipeptide/tripeptide permease